MESVFQIADVDSALLRSECTRAIALVQRALISLDADVLEVGSTAVEGVIGKGDIDLLVRADAAQFSAVRSALDAVLARNPNQLSTGVYQGYLVPSPLDVAVQLTVRGGEHDRFEQFLGALRADASLVAQYNALKRSFDGQSMQRYREAKSAFIERVLAEAVELSSP